MTSEHAPRWHYESKGFPIILDSQSKVVPIEVFTDLLEALRQIVLPLREWLENNPGDAVIHPETTSTAMRLGLVAYDKATSGSG